MCFCGFVRGYLLEKSPVWIQHYRGAADDENVFDFVVFGC
jgi:hypothetical protein